MLCMGYIVSLPFIEIQTGTYIFSLHRSFRESNKGVNMSVLQCQIKTKIIDAAHWCPQMVKAGSFVQTSPTVSSSSYKM